MSLDKTLYRSIWRWHFYAGIFTLPFVLALSASGMLYLFKPYFEQWQENTYRLTTSNLERSQPKAQIDAAIKAIGEGQFLSYRLPADPLAPAIIRISHDDIWQIILNPYTLEILSVKNESTRFMEVVKRFHGELLLGLGGSLLVEIAACWAIALIASGLYLWWPRHAKNFGGILYPRFSLQGRLWWRDLHAVTGIWVSFFALFLLFSGLPWATVWGGALKELRQMQTQDWHQNHGQRASTWRAQASSHYDLQNAVLIAAEALHFAHPVELSVSGENEWKISSQTANRPQRADTWVTKDGTLVRTQHFSDKFFLDRVIGVGIAAHEGQLFGWLNVLLGIFTASSLLALSVSGFMHWRKRKPANNSGAPLLPAQRKIPKAIVGLIIALLIVLPMFTASLVFVLTLEYLVLRRIAPIRDWLNLEKV